jgi:amino acid permease
MRMFRVIIIVSVSFWLMVIIRRYFGDLAEGIYLASIALLAFIYAAR